MADMAAVFTLQGVDQLSGPFSAAAKSIDNVEASAGKANTGLASMATTAARVVTVLGGLTFAGIAAGITSAVTAASSFSTEMSAIGAVSGATATQLKDLQTLALQLGKDTSFSASEAAKGIEELVKAGVSIQDVLGGGARAALDLAAAGGLSVAEAATIASNAMNVFGKSGADMGHVADVIAGAANASAIDVHDFGLSFQQAAAVANLAGVSFEDTATAIALMGNAGIRGSDAGTSLKVMLTNLQPATKAQKEAFEALGLITADGANQFFDATGKAKGLADIAGVLQKATANMTQQQKLATLELLFGTDALRAAAILTNAGAEGFNELAASISKVTASEVAKNRLDNLHGSIEQLKGSVETASIAFGLHLLPAIRSVVDIATGAVNQAIPVLEGFGQQFEDAWNTIGQVIQNDWEPSEAIDPFVNAIGEAASVIRDDFLPVVQSAWAWITDHSEEIIGAFEGVAIAIGSVGTASIALGILSGAISGLLSPIGLLTIAGAALGVAWTTNFGNIQGVVAGFVGWFQQTAMPAVIAAGETLVTWINTSGIPTLTAFGEWLQPMLMASWTWLTTVAFPAIITAGQLVADWFVQKAIPAITEWSLWLKDRITAAWTWFTATALPAIQTAGLAAWAWITTTAIPQLTAWVGWLQAKIEPAWTWLTTTALPAIVSIGSTAWDWITTTAVPYLMQMADWMQAKIQEAWSWFTATALPGIGSAADAVTGQIQNLVSWFQQLGQALADRKVYEDITTAFTNVYDALNLLVPLFAPTKQGFDDTNTAAGPAGSSVQTVADAIKAVSSAIAGATESFNTFVTWLYNVRDALSLIQNYMRSILQMVPNMPAWIAGPQTPAAPRPPGVGAPPPGLQPGPYLPPAPGTGTYVPPDQQNPTGPIQGPPIPPDWAAPGGAVIQPAPAPAPPAAAAPVQIDNSSRAAFARTAWPIFLQAAGGNRDLAQMMIAAAISENGDVGKGGGFVGNNFYGIKAPGPSSATGSFTSPTWEAGVGQTTASFASFPDPVTGANAFMQFLQENPRYAPALAAFQQSGDAEALFRDITAAGYATNKDWGNVIANIRRNQVAPNVPTDTSPAGAPVQMPSVSAPQVNQFDLGLDPADAQAACGPAALEWFMNQYGQTPTAQQALQLAQAFGWDRSKGMYGPGAFSNALASVGIPNTLNTNPTPADIAAAAASGSPFALSTAGHYFQVQGGSLAGLNVGGSGLALQGGSAVMSLDDIVRLTGAVNGLITVVPQATAALNDAGVATQAMGASAAATTPELSNIGAQIDPLVGMFDAGSLSASQLADAEILASDNAGVATETASAYKDGLIDQQTAMLGVLDAFSQTTPAAADMAQGIRDGTLSVDDAAVAFAGLATTTATSTGAIGDATGTLAEKVPTDFATMADGAGTNMTNMVSSAVTLADGMDTSVSGSADSMATDVSGAVGGMAGDVGTNMVNMVGSTVGLADNWDTSVSGSADSMGTAVSETVSGMADGVGTDVSNMVGSTVTLADDWNTSVSGSADDLNTNVSGSTDEMSSNVGDALGALTQPMDDTTTGFGDIGTAAGDATGPASDFGSSLDDVGSAAGSATGPVDDFSSSLDNIEPPDLGDFIGDLKSIQKEAEAAKKKVGDLLDAGNISKGIKGKAGGGAVFHDSMYLVGEQGPELFVPTTSGLIIPNHHLRGLADGGFVSVNGAGPSSDPIPVRITNEFVAVGGPDLTTPLAAINDTLKASADAISSSLADILGQLKENGKVEGTIAATIGRVGSGGGGGTRAPGGGTAGPAAPPASAATSPGQKPTGPLPPGWDWVNVPGIGWTAQPTGAGYGTHTVTPPLVGLPGGTPHTPGQGQIIGGSTTFPETGPSRTAEPLPSQVLPPVPPQFGGGVADATARMSTRSIASATTMSARVGAAVTQMQATSTTQARNMADHVTRSSDTMSSDVTSDVGNMASDSTDDISRLATDGVDYADTMQVGVVRAADLMRTGAVSAADLMRDGVTSAAGQTYTNVAAPGGSFADLYSDGRNWFDLLRNDSTQIIGGDVAGSMKSGVTAGAKGLDDALNNKGSGALKSVYRGSVDWFDSLRKDAIAIAADPKDPNAMTTGIISGAASLNDALNNGARGILPDLYTKAIDTFKSLRTDAIAFANLMAFGTADTSGKSGVTGAFDAVGTSASDAAGMDGIGAVVPAIDALADKDVDFSNLIDELDKIKTHANNAASAIHSIPTSGGGSGAHSSSADVMIAGPSNEIDYAKLADAIVRAQARTDVSHPVAISMTLGSGAEDIVILEAQARTAI